MLALFWVAIIPAESWDSNNKEEEGNIFWEVNRKLVVAVTGTY